MCFTLSSMLVEARARGMFPFGSLFYLARLFPFCFHYLRDIVHASIRSHWTILLADNNLVRRISLYCYYDSASWKSSPSHRCSKKCEWFTHSARVVLRFFVLFGADFYSRYDKEYPLDLRFSFSFITFLSFFRFIMLLLGSRSEETCRYIILRIQKIICPRCLDPPIYLASVEPFYSEFTPIDFEIRRHPFVIAKQRW